MIRSGALGMLVGLLVLLVLATTNVLFYRWILRNFRGLAAHRRVLIVVLSLVTVMGPVGRVLTNRGVSEHFSWAEAISTLWGLALVFALPAIYILEWVLRRPLRAEEVAPPGTIDRRDALVRVGGTLALGAAMVPLARGIARRFDYEIVELPIRIAKLPRALDGYTIVQVSDVHVGVFLGERELGWAAQSIGDLRPDLVVMTGDLVHLRPAYLPLSCDWLRRLGDRARHGVVSILGNHEYYVGRGAVVDAFARARLELLINRSVVVGGAIGIAGVDDMWSASHGSAGPLLEPALATLPPDAPRILLAHQPQFHVTSAPHVDLQLSGHTHGGQIGPLGPVVAGILTDHRVAGLYRRSGSALYVNRGFGTSGPPARVAVRPEITKIILIAG